MRFLENNIFNSYRTHPRDLSVYRIVFCLYILLLPGLPSFAWLGDYLNYYFAPPKISVANLFSGFPQKWFFIALTLINISSFFFMFWGLWTKWSSITFTLSYIVGASFSFSFGKIDHSVLQFYVPLFLGLLGWGQYYSIDNWLKKGAVSLNITNHDQRAFILALFALLISFGFFAAGVLKINGGWLKWDIEGTKYWLHHNYYAGNRTKFLSSFFIGVDSRFLWKIQDYAVLLFEVGILFAAVNIRAFRYFISIAIFFHCMVMLMFNITFSGTIIAYLAFADWRRLRIFIRKIIPYHAHQNILRILFGSSIAVLVFWIGMLIVKPYAIWHPSIAKLIFEGYLYLPGLPELLIFILSIPVLLCLIFLHFRKTDEMPA